MGNSDLKVKALRAFMKGTRGLTEQGQLTSEGEGLLADLINTLPNETATAFWEKVLKSDVPNISDQVRHMLRAAYRKRATLNRAKARTGDLFEEDAKGTLNISFEPVAFNSEGQVYIERRPSCAEKPDEPHPNRQAGMGAVVDHYERPEEAWGRVVKKFEGARIVKVVLVPLDGIFPRHVFDPDRGPFVLHVIAVLLKGKPTNPRGQFFTREEVFQLDLVGSHRDVILPAALKWYDSVGFGIGSEVYDFDVMRKKN